MIHNLCYISVCCNAHTKVFAQTLERYLKGEQPTCICKFCNNVCEVEFKPVYQEKSKGIYSKIKYNEKIYN